MHVAASASALASITYMRVVDHRRPKTVPHSRTLGELVLAFGDSVFAADRVIELDGAGKIIGVEVS